MAKTKPTLAFQDTAPFEANLATFATYLAGLDADLAEAATPLLSRLSEAAMKREEVLDNLMAALLAAEAKAAASKAGGSPAEDAPPSAPVVQDETPEAPPTPVPVQIGWFLEQLEMEGFRGVNNEGAPLVLKFKPDAVSSISAPNGVGKSSIFDALTFALRKSIPKLDNLAATERGRDYYLNRFHTGGVGTITLTVKPTDGSRSRLLSTRRRAGKGRSPASLRHLLSAHRQAHQRNGENAAFATDPPGSGPSQPPLSARSGHWLTARDRTFSVGRSQGRLSTTTLLSTGRDPAR